jgi:diguanylate cyclase (GGDEF)-like protein
MSAMRNENVMRRFSGVRSDLARLGQWRPHRIPAGQLVIWILSLVLIGAAAVLFGAGAGAERPILRSVRVPFWALLLAFAAAERFVFHVHFRRSAHSMSLGEIPLVFALVFASGQDVILAGAIGRLLILALHRKLPPLRLAFNFAQFLLGNCIAVIVFHAVAGSASLIDPIVWAAAALAAGANSVTAVMLISAAVSLSEGKLSFGQVASSLRTDLVVVVANTSVGLCAATLVYRDWRTAILMAVPVAGMFIASKAYFSERQRHDRLEFLYEAARSLSHSSEIGTALESLLAQALEAFRAEVAEIVFFSPDGNDALRTTVRANGAANIHQSLEPTIVEELRALIEGQEAGACATREISDGPLADYLRERELGKGMFAVLQGERSWIGAMMIGNPSGAVDSFSAEDVKLFETLANNTSVALENDRLGQTVWRMKELQRELQHQASHDPLTDLANRLLFAERVGEAVARDPETVSVIFIDVNDFKTVNDSLGHAVGDELLIAIAGRLSDCVRPSDTLARLGGDEFAILLQRTASQDEAIAVAERINRRLAERFSIGGHSISVGVSAGIATGAGGDSPDELVRNADVAMYRAKQASNNGYELFESGMEVPVLEHHSLKQRLREAVQEDSLVVHYQPIVELDTGAVTACEALVRWMDGPRGRVSPASFIPIAEEMGVIVPLGRSVLHRACREAQRWRADGPTPPNVHVNLSPVELRDPHFVSGVASALEASGLSPERLVLEITEGVVLGDPEKSIAILNELRGLGVQLALDDFGTGYSSLSHLRSLPIDWLKIGKPFVDAIEPQSSDRPFIRMILELANSLDLGVVAEGIESGDQLAALRELGCGFGQGFYLGSPTELEPGGCAPRLNAIADFGPRFGRGRLTTTR